mmetsp:Transcript_3868/g.10915  ORF Transcript_3868/g.10915 Transcript_3868/m.10915 type:complete len:216 (+) Transcript_3868:127-774(+)
MEQAPPAPPLEAPSVEAVAAAARQQALDATLEKPLDFEPPAACVMRIVKSAIPDNIQVTKEAKQAFAKAAGIFIVYLTTCANDICKDKKKQTVTAQDILAACGELELDDVKPQLEEFLAALRAHESGKRKAASAPVEEPAAQRPAVEAPPPAEDEDSDDALIWVPKKKALIGRCAPGEALVCPACEASYTSGHFCPKCEKKLVPRMTAPAEKANE